MKGFTLVQNSKSKTFGEILQSGTACSIGLIGTRWSREKKQLRYHHQHFLTTEGNMWDHPATPPKNSLGLFVISCLTYIQGSFECLLTMLKNENIKLRHRSFHHGLIDNFAHMPSYCLPSHHFSSFNTQVKCHLLCEALSNASPLCPGEEAPSS